MNCLNCKFYKEKYEEYLLYIMGYDTFLDKGEMISVINKNKKLKDKGFVFYRSNDDDINALFKRIYIENSLREDKKNAQLEKDFYEYFSRNQRRPLWKSFVEYENFIKSYMEKGTQTTFRKICKTVVSNADKNTNDYNYFGNEQQKILDDYSIKNALVIKSKLKTKELKPSETYIKFNDQVLNLADIFEEESTKGKISREFYYIFADLDGEIEKDKFGELVDKLKESYGF